MLIWGEISLVPRRPRPLGEGTSGALIQISCHGGVSRERINERRLHQECKYQSNSKMDIPICAICCVTLPSCTQQRSLNSEVSAAYKRVVDFLVSVVHPELELAGSAETVGTGGTWLTYHAWCACYLSYCLESFSRP